jgi:hypothetical protein
MSAIKEMKVCQIQLKQIMSEEQSKSFIIWKLSYRSLLQEKPIYEIKR